MRYFSLVIVLATLLGCAAEEIDAVDLPRTPLLSVRPGFALVVAPYLRVFDGDDGSGRIIYHARRGDIIEIVRESDDATWMRIRTDNVEGWVRSRYIRRYASLQQATNARDAGEERSD